jgi:DNA polymerase-3 subunit beta
MKFSVEREALLIPLQAVIGVVERRQTMPILNNVLLSSKDGLLTIAATDLEVELVARTDISLQQNGEITVPGRKMLDIIRALPEKSALTFTVDGERATLRAAKSRFSLSTLPAADFPTVDDIHPQHVLRISQAELRKLIEKTQFAMGQQDVRYYLNGMLLEIAGSELRAVATDGHRLALSQTRLTEGSETAHQVVVPRKGILELQRLLSDEGDLELAVGANHVRATVGALRITSKLIDGRFPDYNRVIPSNPSKIMKADRLLLRTALQRAAILSNEKYRGIRLVLKPASLLLQTHNPEQEEAEEELEVEYDGTEVEIGFNVNYLLDALAAISGTAVEVSLTDSNGGCVMRGPGVSDALYVVMPMRL